MKIQAHECKCPYCGEIHKCSEKTVDERSSSLHAYAVERTAPGTWVAETAVSGQVVKYEINDHELRELVSRMVDDGLIGDVPDVSSVVWIREEELTAADAGRNLERDPLGWQVKLD